MIGDEEHALPSGDSLHVLRHALPGQLQAAGDMLAFDVHLQHLARELAAREQKASVGGEVHVIDAAALGREAG